MLHSAFSDEIDKTSVCPLPIRPFVPSFDEKSGADLDEGLKVVKAGVLYASIMALRFASRLKVARFRHLGFLSGATGICVFKGSANRSSARSRTGLPAVPYSRPAGWTVRRRRRFAI